MDYMLMPWRRYADFSGRSRRKEFWAHTVLVVLAEIVLFGWIMAASAAADGRMTTSVAIPFVLLLILGLAVLIPTLAVTIRRLHDQDKSGWLCLVALVPILGAAVLLAFMCLQGTAGPNRYGPDPRSGAFRS